MIELSEPASYQVVVNRFLRDLTFSACQRYGNTCLLLFMEAIAIATQEPSSPVEDRRTIIIAIGKPFLALLKYRKKNGKQKLQYKNTFLLKNFLFKN